MRRASNGVRRLPGVAAAAAALATAALFVVTFPTGLFAALDASVDAMLRGGVASGGAPVAEALDALGQIAWIGGVVLLLAWALASERRYRDAAVLVGAFVVMEATVLALKAFFERARPLDGLVTSQSASFPSGHAARGAFVAVAFAALAWHRLAPRPRLRAVMVALFLGWGAAMGVARLVLHVHWLSDVVTGALIGAGGAGLVAAAWAPSVRTRSVEVAQPIAPEQSATPQSARQPAPQPVGQPPPQTVRQPPPQTVRQPPPQTVRQPAPQTVRQPPPQPAPKSPASQSGASGTLRRGGDE